MMKRHVMEGTVYVRPCGRGILIDDEDVGEALEDVLWAWGVPHDGRESHVRIRVTVEVVGPATGQRTGQG